MGFLSPKVPAAQAPVAPPPVPQIDDVAVRRMDADRALRRRGRGTTILTSDAGLPNLGTTVTPMAGG